MYYPSSENKGADQLRGYREADLRLCFRLGKNPVFSRCGSFGETRVNLPFIFHAPLLSEQKELEPSSNIFPVDVKTCPLLHVSHNVRKPTFGVSDLVPHKLDCIVTETSGPGATISHLSDNKYSHWTKLLGFLPYMGMVAIFVM